MEISKALRNTKRKLFSLANIASIQETILRVCSRRFLIDKSPISFTENDMDKFLNMLGNNPNLQLFFKNDGCCRIADKYLIAMVFNYFIRAGYTHTHYSSYNFFVALYLAHDMEEDEEDLKNELLCWALGSQISDLYRNFLKSRDNLWRALGHRSVVSLSNCEKIMSVRPEHWAWRRFRSEVHAGANRLDSHIFTEGISISKLLRRHPACWNCCPLKAAIEGATSSQSDTESARSSTQDEEELFHLAVKRTREESFSQTQPQN